MPTTRKRRARQWKGCLWRARLSRSRSVRTISTLAEELTSVKKQAFEVVACMVSSMVLLLHGPLLASGPRNPIFCSRSVSAHDTDLLRRNFILRSVRCGGPEARLHSKGKQFMRWSRSGEVSMQPEAQPLTPGVMMETSWARRTIESRQSRWCLVDI